MPELPEVQTVVSDLNKKIKGHSVVSFWSDFPSAIKNATLEKFQKEIKNRKILGARRIGKNMFLDLSGGKTLYLHLKMTGHLLIKKEVESRKYKAKENSKSQISNHKSHDYFDDKVNKYVHHSWKLKSPKGEVVDLDFSDLRKFAKIVLVDTDKVLELPEIKKLGIDAMDPKFDLKKFEEILGYPHPGPLPKRARGNAEPHPNLPLRKVKGNLHKPIGIVLMDQEAIAGIGNIYRSEILFAAGVNPQRKVKDLEKEEVKNIFKQTIKILKKAIELRGTSDSDYRDTSGAPGQFHKMLKVYRKDKEACSSRNGKKCGKIIKRITMAQRSVFFCPSCQK